MNPKPAARHCPPPLHGHAAPTRRALLTRALTLPLALPVALPAALATLLTGCASPAPELRRLRLPDLPAAAEPARPPGATDRPGPPGRPWQLMEPLALPAWLDDERVWQADGAAGLRPVAGLRWAEPLRDALPRVLQQDLADALGGPGQVWRAPLPPGLRIGRQLRLQILALQPDPSGRNLLLQAQWSLAAPDGAQPPQVGSTRLTQPLAGPPPDALALAMRQALRRLAAQIVAEAR